MSLPRGKGVKLSIAEERDARTMNYEPGVVQFFIFFCFTVTCCVYPCTVFSFFIFFEYRAPILVCPCKKDVLHGINFSLAISFVLYTALSTRVA